MRSRITEWLVLVGILVAVYLVFPVSRVEGRQPIKGTHANAWNAAAVAISGTSSSLDTAVCDSGNSSAFGNTSGAATLTVQFSQDNTNWYSSATNTGSVTGNFGVTFSHGARYIRLISNAAVTITATLACH